MPGGALALIYTIGGAWPPEYPLFPTPLSLPHAYSLNACSSTTIYHFLWPFLNIMFPPWIQLNLLNYGNYKCSENWRGFSEHNVEFTWKTSSFHQRRLTLNPHLEEEQLQKRALQPLIIWPCTHEWNLNYLKPFHLKAMNTLFQIKAELKSVTYLLHTWTIKMSVSHSFNETIVTYWVKWMM